MDDITILQEEIERISEMFREYPYDFLYEADLQAMLFSLLFKRFEKRVCIAGGFRSSDDYGKYKVIQTNRVKCEYRYDLKRKWKFDVAIIDKNHILHYGDNSPYLEGLKNDPFWNQPVRAGIEIKLCQFGNKLIDKVNSIRSDINKLKEYRKNKTAQTFLGIALVFLHPQIFNMNDLLENILKELDEKEIEDKDDFFDNGVYLYVISIDAVGKFKVTEKDNV